MTEFEKMTLGLVYHSMNPEMEKLRMECKVKCREYNASPETDPDKRTEMLKNIVAKLGEGSRIEPTFMAEYGSNIFIGDGAYINFDSIMLDCGKIHIGDNVWMGPRVCIYTVNHSLDAEERLESVCTCGDVTIGENTWIGGNTVILKGVTIGKNSVIGAGSVVKHDIPDGVLAAGVPCQVIRPITEKDRLQNR